MAELRAARHIWILTSGEPLPMDEAQVRLLRHGLLAKVLLSRGWQVTWFTSAFDHTSKIHRKIPPAGFVEVSSGYNIILLASAGYRRNVSWARLRDHAQIARAFSHRVRNMPPPSVVLCSYPTLHLSDAATRYGQERNVPVVLDLRDMWPDIFVELVPRSLQWLSRVLLHTAFAQSQRSLQSATALFGITEGFLNWGLARAQRQRQALDHVFELAYEQAQVSDEERAQAKQFWQDKGLQPEHEVVCFFGALGRQFDFDTVLRAAALLRVQRASVRIVICGVGESQARLARQAASLGNVLVPGWVNRAQIAALMGIGVCGLAPYVNETSFTLSLPNKFIEYWAGGLPVLSCLKGTSQAVLESTGAGKMYEAGDSGSLCAALLDLCCDFAWRADASMVCKRLFTERYSADLVYSRMATALDQIALSAPMRPSPIIAGGVS